ncbi:hypothetical protein N7454_001517 [Penicillium verhagenii]|nr:hypothetical protein N7454_001517 [Penicillium verhagenii]
MEYPLYSHESLSTFSPVPEDLHISEPELLNLHLPLGAAHMSPTYPETPRLSRVNFNSSPGQEDRQYSCPHSHSHSHTHAHSHSPDYARMQHHQTSPPYGTSARMPPNPTNYNPYCSQIAPPTETTLPNRDAHTIHRRTSSASSTGSLVPFERERSHQHRSFKCKWEGCRYTGAFGRKFELKRHVETQHINPNSYECPGCRKGYNRKDNLEEHLRRAHVDMCEG